jgi:cytoskeletal protein RodZ
MTGVGEQLQRARQHAGLSVQELSARTKIPARFLEAIERDDFSGLPGGIFTRGFLSAYAREVHLDPQAVIADYAAAHLPPPPEPPPAPAEPRTTALMDSPRLGAWIQGVTAAAILASLYLLAVIPGATPPDEPKPAATTGSTESNGTAAEPVAASLVTESEPPSPPGTFSVEIRPAGVVWVEAEADGEQAIYRLMQADERVTIDARNEVNIRVGDAAAFRYSIEGRPGRPLGGPGEVREVRLTPRNYQEFLETPRGISPQ